jgi:thymidylate synthase (FAD)
MKVTLIDKLGTDLTVVNAARVSFDKESSWEVTSYDEKVDLDSRSIAYIPITKLKSGDEKLINFLAKHNHWSPFAHAQVQLRIKAPIFVARQLGKHQVGLVWNEISRRYVDSEPEFYFPEKWRKKNPDKKQGSMEDEFVDFDFAENITIKNASAICLELYKAMLSQGVCAEQARMVLPQNMYTEWYWTGSLYAFARVCGLRLKKDTQAETRVIAQQIDELIAKEFPVSWKALTKNK